MLVLAIDTSSRTGSIALLEPGMLRAECLVHAGADHSETILRAIDQALAATQSRLEDVDLFAVTLGPGAFTGLRIGTSLVKGFSLSTRKPAVGVSTLDALALNMSSSRFQVCPMLDAKKNEVYTSLYDPRPAGFPEQALPEMVCEPEGFLSQLSGKVIFLGDGALRYRQLISGMMPDSSFFAPDHLQWVRASAVGIIGLELFKQGKTLDPAAFTPRYLRHTERELRIARAAGDADN